MNLLPLGKVPWSLLVELVKKQGFKHNKGIIQTTEQGVDVAVLDLKAVIDQVNEIYQTHSIPYLVYKSDPITFPTPNPAEYLIIVNKNDLATAGALPYGITVTILLPPNSTKEFLLELQSNISDSCKRHHITILGGHTEITQGVQNPILSASMIGFVPPEFYIPRDPQLGDSIICSGWVGAEGTGILLAEANELLSKYLSPTECQQGVEISTNLDVSNQVISCNRRWHNDLHLVHDATEGGILGALYECLAPKGFGAEIVSERIPLAPVTKKLAEFLKIDPFKLIASGAVLFICDREKAPSIVEFLKEKNRPAEIIGEVTDKKSPIQVDGFLVQPPEADHLIRGLTEISKLRKANI
ncbi:MAG: AIR synthase-related protein [Candidatus Hodarchaeales archaeon]|jgi:hydrogenase maturation factor